MDSHARTFDFALTSPMISALALLLRAYDYGRDAEADPWQFSVEYEPSRMAGVTLTDLRWLLAKGFVHHAREVTAPGDEERSFRSLSGTDFPRGTCLRLTDDGAMTFRPLVMNQPCPPLIDPVLSGRVEPAARDYSPTCTEGHPNGAGTVAKATENEGNDAVSMHSAADDSSPDSAKSQDGSASSGGEQAQVAIPVWDSILRELRLGPQVIKRYRVPAANQELVLTVFEEDGWPSSIDDPLPPVPEIDPKRRLQSTVKSLNRNQISPLLRFHANGNARRVTWERTDEAARDSTSP